MTIGLWIFLGLLGALLVVEVVRFRRAGDDPDDVPYPAARLKRRAFIACFFATAILLTQFAPQHGHPKLALSMMGLVAICVILGMRSIFKDLAETSRAVVEHAQNLDRTGGAELRELMAAEKEAATLAQSPSPSPDSPEKS